MWQAVPIRLLIPALVLILGLGTNTLSYFSARNVTFDLIIEQRYARLRADLSRHQLDLEGATDSERQFFQRVVSGLLHYPDVVLATLIDAEGDIEASTRLAEVGQRADEDTLGIDSARLAGMLDRPAPTLWLSADRRFLSGVIRVCRVSATTLGADQRCGAMVLREDLRPQLMAVGASLREQLVYNVLLTLLLVALIVAVLYASVVRRLEDIVETAVLFGRGETNARVTIGGADEIATIGRAINLMLDRVASTQRRLRNRQAHLTALFNENTEGLIVINRHGMITEFNRRAESIFGYRAEEVLGQNVEMLMAAREAQRHHTMMARHLASGERRVIGSKPLRTEALHRDGHLIPVSIGVSEVQAADDPTFIGSVTDLTAMRSLEQQAERAQKMEAVGALTGGIAHDFNNLLGIIIGNLDMLRRQVSEQPALLKRIEKAMHAAGRGSALTSKLLNFSRQRPERAEPVNLLNVMTDIEALLDHSLTSRISLSVDLPTTLPPILVDPGSLADVIVNLVLNARDAMPDGGGVRIAAQHRPPSHPIEGQLTLGQVEGDVVEIAIADEGSGIAPEMLDKVFEPFFSTKPKEKGTGLGLAMVYGFIKRSSGAIGVDSTVSVGTTIRLYLPIADTQPLTAPSMTENAETPAARSGERVLLVEDEEHLRELAGAELTRLGYELVEADTAAAAWTVLERDTRFDLLFTDIMMPGEQDGLALAEEVRQRYPEMAVLLTTGFAGRDATERPETDQWRSRVLEKPYTLRQLAQRVREAIDRPLA